MERKFFKETLGLDLDKDQLDKIMAEHGKTVEATKTNIKTELDKTIESLKVQITERDTQIDEIKKKVGTESPETTKKIEELQALNTTQKEDFEKKLKDQEFNFKLENKLSEYGSKNNKALKAILDLDKISLDKDNFIGLEEQITAKRESDPYFFDEKSKDGTGGGTNPSDTKTPASDLEKLSDEEFYKSLEEAKK